MLSASGFLLDTCVFIWLVTDAPQLNPKIRSLIEDSEVEVFLSAASAAEMATKVALGKLTFDRPISQFLPWARQQGSLTELPVSEAHAALLAELPLHHRDPFDRLLVTQAIAEDLILLSPDPAIHKYPAKIYWPGITPRPR